MPRPGFCSGNGIAALGRIFALERLQMGECVSYCRDAAELDKITAKKIAECAKRGEADAAAVYTECGKKLGAGLSVIMDLLNPEVIVIGSVYERSGELLKEAMYSVIEKEALPQTRQACRIVPAQLGDSIGDYAALSIAVMALQKINR